MTNDAQRVHVSTKHLLAQGTFTKHLGQLSTKTFLLWKLLCGGAQLPEIDWHGGSI